MRTVRLTSAILAAVFAFPLVLVGCSDAKGNNMDAEPYATLQACFDEHHKDESLSVHDSIVVCCLDHPIAGKHPSCGVSQTECVGHVSPALDSSVTSNDVDAACASYVEEL
jgi:hypothetical protein